MLCFHLYYWYICVVVVVMYSDGIVANPWYHVHVVV